MPVSALTFPGVADIVVHATRTVRVANLPLRTTVHADLIDDAARARRRRLVDTAGAFRCAGLIRWTLIKALPVPALAVGHIHVVHTFCAVGIAQQAVFAVVDADATLEGTTATDWGLIDATLTSRIAEGAVRAGVLTDVPLHDA